MRARQPERTVREYVEQGRARVQAKLDAMPDPDWTSTPKPAAVTAEHAVREKVNEARRRAKALTRKWRLAIGGEDRRLDGRPVELGSMTPEYVGGHGAVNNLNRSGT